MNFNQLPNMYQFQQPVSNYAPSQLIRVTGLDGAKAYQMSANSTVALFDSGSDLMYIKSTDGAGFPTIRTFQFTEVIPKDNSTDFSAFVTREEFEELKEMINNAKQFVPKSGKPTKQQTDAE